MRLKDKVLFITGASRGIGLAIALRAARDGACVAIAAKTATPHPKVRGTIYAAAEQVEAAGGRALPLVCDVRDEVQVRAAVAAAAQHFGGIDICVNNASAIDLGGTAELPLRKYDLLQQINVRGTFLVTRECLPHLLRAANPHVLNLAPPLPIPAQWLGTFPAYSQTKAAMSFYAAAMAVEHAQQGVAFNTLWPQTMIATAAVEFIGGAELLGRSRRPEIMADAAHWILTQPARDCTGRHFIDEDVLVDAGQCDLSGYRALPGDGALEPDLFVQPRPQRPGVRY